MVIQDFKNKQILITGGTRGIGAAISTMFSDLGAKLHLVYRSDQASAAKHLESLSGHGHKIYQVDVTDAESLKMLFDGLVMNIDILINNAGIAYHHPLFEESYESWQTSWDDILSVNLKSVANICYLAAQQMQHGEGGRIINISSRGAFRGEPLMPAYGASKAALNSMTQSLAHYLAPHNIFVGAVAPGFVETEMSKPRLSGDVGAKIKAQSPMNRVAKPEEIAKSVLTMCQAPQWMTGSIFDANGASYFRT